MGEAPCIAAPRRAAAHFRLPRHGRRKVLVVRLGGGGARWNGRGLRLRRWLRRSVWRLAELCAAALSGHPGGPRAPAPAPWTGVEPYFAAPFVPVALMKRAEVQD
ncbi:uncharacterized protein LOC133889103 [Phragmites australis]|uniref:uncharacterized protein LOC133889103 n=1 Tax=Phragmites australis TaxID=29695 RepID=UPI002D76D19B|nr:uncharacterized protein LOC133889103 [Phragmites australis]